MADRFPSLEDIDAGQTEPRGDGNLDLINDSGDTSDFLSRERAALGEDADQFATPADNAATVENDEDDLLGGGDSAFETGGAAMGKEEMTGFESSFPAINSGNEQVAPGGTITGTPAPYLPGVPSQYSTFSDEPEPEVIREWRERRDLAIQHRDQVSAEKRERTIKEAQQNIDDFYENYNNKREKGIKQTQKEAEDFLASRDDTTSGGTSWERIAKLVDLSGKGSGGGASGTGKAKFRELLLSLRKDEKAPGATGV